MANWVFFHVISIIFSCGAGKTPAVSIKLFFHIVLIFFSGSGIATGRIFLEVHPNFTATKYAFIDDMGAFLSSPDNTFHAAMYNPAGRSQFYFCVIHVESSAIIWSGNRDVPVSSSGRLDLTARGLTVSHENGTRVWSTPTLSSPATTMQLSEDGNLVLLDAGNRSIWASFDHPTNTMVPGQLMGSILRSSKSDSDFAAGDYSLSLTSNDAILVWKSEQQYWSLSRDLRAFKDTNDMVSFLQLNQTGLHLCSRRNSAIWSIPLSSDGFPVAIIRPDGRFTVQVFSGGSWRDQFLAPADSCHLPLSCGSLSLCSGSACTCPPRLLTASSSGGCLPETGTSLATCNSSATVSYLQLGSKWQYFATKFQNADSNSVNLSTCERSCTSNCTCRGFFFDNSSASCYLLRRELGSLYVNDQLNAMLGFIKVVGRRKPGKAASKMLIVLLIVLPSLAALVVFVVMAVWILRQRRTSKAGKLLYSSSDISEIQIPGMPKRFRFRELEVATENFSMEIGSGGFGVVYRGKMLDGSTVAVKKIGEMGVEGKKEFVTEIAVIGSIRHANLVKLRGFCSDGKRRLLVYEYMNRGSLDRVLFSDAGPVLEWAERVEIARGTARGLAYLHGGCEHKIIHCDIKPENILLHDLQVKISDFGLSKLITPEQSALFTTMRGTRGYLAPEWLMNAAITDRADVYSYGMVLLELVRGRKNYYTQGESESSGLSSQSGSSSSSWCYFPLLALELHEQGRYLELADPRLQGRVMVEEVERLIRIALCCVQEDPSLRPPMAAVVGMLAGGVSPSSPRRESLQFLRFYGRRFAGNGDSGHFLPRHLPFGSSTGSGEPFSPACQSAQQLSGPR